MEPSRDTSRGGAVLEQCPHCRGAVRPGAPWCTQCWTDLRPAPAPESAAQELAARAPGSAGQDPAAPAPARQAAQQVGEPARPGTPRPAGKGWPCSACAEVNAVELDACVACGTGFLAGLRASEQPLLAVPGLGDLGRYSRAQRLGLAAGVVLAVCVLVLLAGLLSG